LLSFSIGLPFFAVATSSPLLQRWFAGLGYTSSSDPYYLYSASNLGSLAALLSYPLLVEPLLPLAVQRRIWMAGYVVFFLLTAGCAVCFWKSAAPAQLKKNSTASHPPTALALGWKQRPRWLMLAFVPSSLMLSVTTYLTTDIAAIPLLWLAPL